MDDHLLDREIKAFNGVDEEERSLWKRKSLRKTFLPP